MNFVAWSGKRVLLTGHSGFKGSWMTLLLHQLGAEVFGISLKGDDSKSIFLEAKLSNFTRKEQFIDIRDSARLSQAIKEINPDFVFHFAAQSLVRESVRNPLVTISTNVIGSVNVVLASLE